MKKHKALVEKSKRLRALFTVVLATAALFAWSVPAHAVETHETTLVAGKPNLFGVHYNLSPQAKLTDNVTGKPIAGETIDFMAEAPSGYLLPVCKGVTDAQGIAKCGGFGAVFKILQSPNKQYTAYYTGRIVGEIRYYDSFDTVLLGGR